MAGDQIQEQISAFPAKLWVCSPAFTAEIGLLLLLITMNYPAHAYTMDEE